MKFHKTDIKCPISFSPRKSDKEILSEMKNWYKLAVKPRYYGQDENDVSNYHDFDPSWDYEEDTRPPRKMMKVFEQAANDIVAKYMNEFNDIFSRFRISFVTSANGGLAQYASGTYGMPVILIDLRLCSKSQKELKNELTMYQVALSTLMHELRHAYQEGDGMTYNMTRQELEDDAEDFCRRFI